MKTKQIQVKSAIAVGNEDSDVCYAERNAYNINHFCGVPFVGWNCYSEDKLIDCLAHSGDPNWWKDFFETKAGACDYTGGNGDRKTYEAMECGELTERLKFLYP